MSTDPSKQITGNDSSIDFHPTSSAGEEKIARFLTQGSSRYELTAKDASELKVCIPLVRTLYIGGVIDKRSFNRIILAFQEAFTNSLEHGLLELDSGWKEQFDAHGVDLYSLRRIERLSDPMYASRRLSVSSEFFDWRLEIKICDEGKGFLPSVEKISLLESQDLVCYGRGIPLITRCVDEIYYSNHGREITLVKDLSQKTSQSKEE